jgi:hypothetical protein
MTPACPREVEVVTALVERRDDSDVLTVHAEACEACREVVMVTRVMVEDRETARREIRVPAAGQVWWRAAVRARLEAVHAAARPLTWLHGAAGAAACGLLVAVLGIVWPFLRETTMWLIAQALVASSVGETALRMGGALQQTIPIVLVAGACLVLAPLAVYFALSDD